jgi:hypothetical protein
MIEAAVDEDRKIQPTTYVSEEKNEKTDTDVSNK